MKKALKKRPFLRALLCVLLAVILVVAAYAAYVFISYDRLPLYMGLLPENNQSSSATTGKEYKITSFNIGFGAYEPDYSFFMDGGTESWAFSKERLEKNMAAISAFLQEQKSDFFFLQEVDEHATRTYHVNEREIVSKALPTYGSVWAQNWDSAFLFYPFHQPHGANRCGLMTFSSLHIFDAVRHQLPVEDTVMKVADLDRCYSVSSIPVDNGKMLMLYNVHLSAYSSDGKIAEEQLTLLIADMESQYQAGNYVVCGGDFNKDLLGDSAKVFGISGEAYTWSQPIPMDSFNGTHLSLVARYDESDPIPSCRVADAPYSNTQFVLTLDGFIVSDNVTVISENTVDTSFKYSDHNPVEMVFSLNP